MSNAMFHPVSSSRKSTLRFLSEGQGLVRRWMANWQARALIARLDRLDDKLLQDAGLNRCDIAWARQLPLAVNAEQALARRVGHR
ncbi:MAG: DUF1127 domain-containing protein [Alphaproteobacteria bacterium]|nr:DUF1127 domain-containing protein [Alphaproteobacteria bacterium]